MPGGRPPRRSRSTAGPPACTPDGRRRAGGVIVGDGIAVVIRHVLRCETVFSQQHLRLRRGLDELHRPCLGGLLMQVVPVEKIHHMGKGGGGRIVEQPRRALAEIAGEVPHDQPHAHAVVKPGVGRPPGKAGEGCVLAPAVHAHLPQPGHGRRLRQTAEEFRNLRMIQGPIFRHGALRPPAFSAGCTVPRRWRWQTWRFRE